MSEIILITVVFCFHAITQSIFWWVVGNNCLKHAFMIHPYLGWLSLIDHFFLVVCFSGDNEGPIQQHGIKHENVANETSLVVSHMSFVGKSLG